MLQQKNFIALINQCASIMGVMVENSSLGAYKYVLVSRFDVVPPLCYLVCFDPYQETNPTSPVEESSFALGGDLVSSFADVLQSQE